MIEKICGVNEGCPADSREKQEQWIGNQWMLIIRSFFVVIKLGRYRVNAMDGGIFK